MDKKIYTPCPILSHEKLASNIYKMVVSSKIDAKCGQFFMLKAWKQTMPYLSRPISICDKTQDTLTFLYITSGRGTDIFSQLQKGDSIEILGALGNGFDTEKIQGKVALVAGGIGIAPFLYLAKELKKKGSSLDLYVGFNNEVYFLEEMKEYTDHIHVYTMDGSTGKQGYPLQDLQEDDYDYIVSCGPTPMMKALKDKMKNPEKLYLSLENRMGCGIGACLSCSTKTDAGMKSVCINGPVFCAKQLTAL